jgi:hypothetical protein
MTIDSADLLSDTPSGFQFDVAVQSYLPHFIYVLHVELPADSPEHKLINCCFAFSLLTVTL